MTTSIRADSNFLLREERIKQLSWFKKCNYFAEYPLKSVESTTLTVHCDKCDGQIRIQVAQLGKKVWYYVNSDKICFI